MDWKYHEPPGMWLWFTEPTENRDTYFSNQMEMSLEIETIACNMNKFTDVRMSENVRKETHGIGAIFVAFL